MIKSYYGIGIWHEIRYKYFLNLKAIMLRNKYKQEIKMETAVGPS